MFWYFLLGFRLFKVFLVDYLKGELLFVFHALYSKALGKSTYFI